MTIALTPDIAPLTDTESAALRRLGVPVDDKRLRIEISWHDGWRRTPAERGPITQCIKAPTQWIVEYTEVIQHQTRSGADAIEYGPDYAETRTPRTESGLLDDLDRYFAHLLDPRIGDFLDEDTGITLEINGWALKVLGLLDGLDIDGEEVD